ncbi:MAG TPA: hypothetical protein VLF95_13395 [Vicinamibacteria bacterium]|nr:hypothetical protein [Vicinamibacteria bacterium]
MRRLAAVLLGGLMVVPLATAQAPPEPAAPAPAQPAPAQPAPAPPAKAPSATAPEYDPKAEVTIKGVVEDFHESKMRGDHPGLHLLVKTDVETVEVHACPVRFMSELDFVVAKGDEVTVNGSRPEAGGILVAREITKGQTSLILRDKSGSPVWTR